MNDSRVPLFLALIAVTAGCDALTGGDEKRCEDGDERCQSAGAIAEDVLEVSLSGINSLYYNVAATTSLQIDIQRVCVAGEGTAVTTGVLEKVDGGLAAGSQLEAVFSDCQLTDETMPFPDLVVDGALSITFDLDDYGLAVEQPGFVIGYGAPPSACNVDAEFGSSDGLFGSDAVVGTWCGTRINTTPTGSH